MDIDLKVRIFRKRQEGFLSHRVIFQFFDGKDRYDSFPYDIHPSMLKKRLGEARLEVLERIKKQ